MKVPVIIKISSIVAGVIALCIAFFGVMLFFFSGFDPDSMTMSMLIAGGAFLFGIIMVIISIALWKGKKWARIVLIPLAIASGIFFISFMISEGELVTELLIFALIGVSVAVLLIKSFFDEGCKAFFNRTV